jgi:hypothetical protein
MIKIEFEYIESETNIFRDAIVLEDNHNLSDEQIAQIKQERIERWLQALYPLTEEQIKDINPSTEGE